MKSGSFSKVDEIITVVDSVHEKCLNELELRSKYLEWRWETLISKGKRILFY